MLKGCWSGAAVAAGVILFAAAAWAAPSSDAPESASQNVHESQQYEQLICSNPGFRASRIAKECGSLQGSQFYQGCVASFQCNGGQRRYRNQAPPSETISK